MGAIRRKNSCTEFIDRVSRLLAAGLGTDPRWVQEHVISCPRCRRRVARLSRVELALALVKNNAHNLNLLKRANTQTIGVLARSVRATARAERLRNTQPEPTILERSLKYRHAVARVAACVTVAVLMKVGTFASAKEFDSKGRKAMEQYYASRAGQELTSEIFKTNA